MILTLRNRLKILVYAGTGLLFVASFFQKKPFPNLSLSTISFVEVGLVVLIMLFDYLVWRWAFVPRLLKTGPVLRGTWKGTIRPTEGSADEIEAYLSVRQTFTGVAFRLITAESISESSSALLTQRLEGLGVAEYMYENVPRDAVRSASPIHFGATRLEAVGPRPDRLEGNYFTSRKTSGELEFNRHHRTIAHTFEDAQKLFGAA